MTPYPQNKRGRPKGAAKPCRFECRVGPHFKNQLAYLRAQEQTPYFGKSDSFIIEDLVTMATLNNEFVLRNPGFNHKINYSLKIVNHDNT